MDTPNDDYDNPWKAGLERYIWDFIVLFCPGLAAEIDWSVEPEFRDQELRQVTRDAKCGMRRLDKLVRVQLLGGSELYIHIEVQLSRQRGFAERMFTCWSRLFERYACPVVSIAVLADRCPGWRPCDFSREMWGTRIDFEFTMVKLMEPLPESSEQTANFFALVREAHFATLRTKREPQARLECKILLTKWAYRIGWGEQRILDFLNVLDWLMQMPAAQEFSYRAFLHELEERMKMPYVHSMVREGHQQGRQEGLQEGLQEGQLLGGRRMLEDILASRFGPLPDAFRLQLLSASPDELSRWARRALAAQSLAEVTEA